MLSDLLEYVRTLYNTFYGWYITVAVFIFIMVYGLISYLGTSHTTTPPLNMGIPVANYTGEYWATYIANVAISVPLTIIIIWFLLHLIKVVFKIDLVSVIKQLFDASNPMYYLINTVDKGLENAENKTAEFIHSLKLDSLKVKPENKEAMTNPTPYKKAHDAFIPDYTMHKENIPVSFNNQLASYGVVEGSLYEDKNILIKLN
jgi:hypothetical protein